MEKVENKNHLPDAGKDSNTLELISSSAKQRILHQPHLSVQRIWCDFDGRRLFLRGQVPSFYFKQLAQEAVADMDEIEQVVNEIEVLW